MLFIILEILEIIGKNFILNTVIAKALLTKFKGCI
jgi:hypothetical protein